MPRKKHEIVLSEDGKLEIPNDVKEKLLHNTLDNVKAIPEIDKAVRTLAKEGDMKAVDAFYKRVGLNQGNARELIRDDEGLLEVSTHELQRELQKRLATPKEIEAPTEEKPDED